MSVFLRGAAAACLACVTAASATAQASAPQDERGPRPGPSRLSVSHVALDLTELNRALGGATLPSVPGNRLAFGGGGAIEWGSWSLEGRGSALLPWKESARDDRLRLGGGFGTLEVARVWAVGPATSLSPHAGIGAGVLELRIDRGGAGDFQDVLAEPMRGADLRGWAFFVTTGLGLDHAIAPFGRPMRVGVRSSVRHELGGPRWGLFDGEVANGPELGMDGWSVEIHAGMPMRGMRDMLTPLLTYGLW